MWRLEQSPTSSGSPRCPDLLRHVGGPRSPLSPLYLSFFEEECRAIATRLRLGDTRPVTSTPLHALPPLDEGTPDSATPAARPSTGDGEAAAAAPGPAGGEPRRLLRPAAGGCPGAARPGSRLARPQAQCRKAARRGAGQPPCGGPGPANRSRTPGRSPGRGGGRLPLSRARASLGSELPKTVKGLRAPATRLPQPAGTKPKLLPAAKSSLQHPSGALQLLQPFAVPKPTPRDTETESAVKVGGCKQPSQRLSTAIPTVASCSRLWPRGKAASLKRSCLDPTSGSTTRELMCNRTLERKENDKSKEQLFAAWTVLGADKADQTWVCLESSFSSELAPGPTLGCGDAVPAEQSAGDQLSQELKRVKNELEQVKSELADKTALCEVYTQVISSLQRQLRAAGISLEDAPVEESGNSGRD
ncbi:uncharacterized protein LOC141964650 isoform X1 [Athene noctua]|uniref:uncharacterized protein LOC141964650 isoform X1 n=1 Tax=Athene noctua TaxID=126797 RepID=UPI003EBB039B